MLSVAIDRRSSPFLDEPLASALPASVRTGVTPFFRRRHGPDPLWHGTTRGTLSRSSATSGFHDSANPPAAKATSAATGPALAAGSSLAFAQARTRAPGPPIAHPYVDRAPGVRRMGRDGGDWVFFQVVKTGWRRRVPHSTRVRQPSAPPVEFDAFLLNMPASMYVPIPFFAPHFQIQRWRPHPAPE